MKSKAKVVVVGKGAVGVAVTNAAKDYVVLLGLDGYSEVSYNGSVDVP